MRALTLTQPWAGLVASGIKLVENRPRRMVKREDFGQPFAIHASREVDESVFDRIFAIAPELRPDPPGPRGFERIMPLTPWDVLARVTSSVIAVAVIDRVIALQHERETEAQLRMSIAPETIASWGLGDQIRWFFGPVGYVLRDVRALAAPVPCRGWQGFWTLPEDIEARVREQL